MHDARRTLAGRYELAGVVGRGGMGTVYRATDLVLRRPVAVKLLAGALLEDPVGVARFEREARASASLAHPGIVAVYDTGVDDGSRYIVMELVPGQSLAELIADRGAFEPDRAIVIAGRIADALAAAHAAGLVHRDIKPGNVMVTDDGLVKVLDFGIARPLDGTTMTQTASVLGTAAYMAPEQALGAKADERSDIYSLGCVLYALLTGGPPFAGESAPAITHQHVHVEPARLTRADRRLPGALDTLVMAMLSKSPDARPQTATEVRDRLADLLAAPQTDVTRVVPTASPTQALPGTAATRALRGTAATRALPGTAAAQAPPGTAATQARPGTAAAQPVPRAGQDRRRRVAVAGLAVGLVLAAAVVIAVGGRAHTPAPAAGQRAATATSTSTSTSVASRSASSPAAQSGVTNGATGPTTPSASTGSPTSAAGAAGAISALVTQGVQVGEVAQQAATQITNGLAGILSASAAGNAHAAQEELTTLTRSAGVLEARGQISPITAAALDAGLSALSAALAAAPPVTAPAAGPAAARAAPAAPGGGLSGRGGPQTYHGRGPFGRGGSFRG